MILMCTEPGLYMIYHIAGNFGEVFNLANWRVIAKFKARQILQDSVIRTRSVSVVAKFKTRQHVLKTDLPNLMLAKFSCYTVYHLTIVGIPHGITRH